MALEFGLGDRRPGGREHDHQRGYAGDAVVGGAQGDDCGGVVSSALGRPFTVAVTRCATQIQATSEVAVGLDSRGRLSLRRGAGAPVSPPDHHVYADKKGRTVKSALS